MPIFSTALGRISRAPYGSPTGRRHSAMENAGARRAHPIHQEREEGSTDDRIERIVRIDLGFVLYSFSWSLVSSSSARALGLFATRIESGSSVQSVSSGDPLSRPFDGMELPSPTRTSRRR